ncbi:MAG: Holliday junction branch migration protein RuvA [Deltaproteobacteria bacterium]|nr:Holliday junction branch migration protein RuvA [Deltaproteobacteria bacterium]
MIGYLSGTYRAPASSPEGSILVEIGGAQGSIGYEVLVPSRVSRKYPPGSKIELFIHTHVREDALDLFGFESEWEKKVFLALTGVSGVGPRTAIGILSQLEAEELLGAIVREDKDVLKAVSGVGKKTSERLIVELSEKARKLFMEKNGAEAANAAGRAARAALKSASGASVSPQGAVSGTGLAVMAEAVAALVALGYRDAEAWPVVRDVRIDTEGSSLETLIRRSLQRMAQR